MPEKVTVRKKKQQISNFNGENLEKQNRFTKLIKLEKKLLICVKNNSVK